ncbi:MAG: lysophospholipid acyltransferase family protein, partial [Burkholderiaceae bacterium]
HRVWRVVATAIAFSSFGLGGLVLRFAVFPWLSWRIRDSAARARAARRIVQRSFAGFIELMRVLGILSYQIRGAEKLARPGLLIVANHPTLIDVVFLISLVRNADCVVKASLLANPFTRGPVRTTGYVCNDSGAGLIEDCTASLAAGACLVIFPEGTRSTPGAPLHLQRGAANIAVRSGCALTPVTLRCEPLSLTKGLPWWQVPARPMVFTIEVGDDISPAPFLAASGGETPAAARRLTTHLHDYFTLEARRHAGT